MRQVRQAIAAATVAAMLLVLGLAAYAGLRDHPENLPWTKLALDQPVGLFTGRKLIKLRHDTPLCLALLRRAGVRYELLAPVHVRHCGYDDAVRLEPGGALGIGFDPPRLGTACPVAAALAMWQWNVVQPAAERRFHSRVVTVVHFGSYNCRPIAGETTWSEHATADAIDVAGFRFADGTRITVARDWQGKDAKAAFLRDVRNGACKLFATVLSPDYNAAHHDHLHLDQAERGAWGWRACR